MSTVTKLKEKVLGGELITRQEALELFEAPLTELCEAADEIRAKMSGNGFDICTIINGKCGRCSEDCKYCAQSAHYHMLNIKQLLKHVKKQRKMLTEVSSGIPL